MRIHVATVVMVLALSAATRGNDQGADSPATTPPATAETVEQTDRERLFKRFEETLDNVKFVGKFTILGRDDGPLRKEEYTISRVEKQPDGDYWLFHTRIKYGENDLQVPLRLEVKWAGTTPVITLTDFIIPALGTFSARVVIHHGKYAGTWSHGEVGGHLFGTIEKIAADQEADKTKPEEADKPTDSPTPTKPR